MRSSDRTWKSLETKKSEFNSRIPAAAVLGFCCVAVLHPYLLLVSYGLKYRHCSECRTLVDTSDLGQTSDFRL